LGTNISENLDSYKGIEKAKIDEGEDSPRPLTGQLSADKGRKKERNQNKFCLPSFGEIKNLI